MHCILMIFTSWDMLNYLQNNIFFSFVISHHKIKSALNIMVVIHIYSILFPKEGAINYQSHKKLK